MIGWLITIVVSFFIARLAIKFDYKYNNGWVMSDFDEVGKLVVVVCALILPFVNILASLLLWGFVLYEKLDSASGKNVEKIVSKIFFINKEKINKKVD